MSNVTFAQIPLELIRHVRKLKLSGAEYDLWLYLWELDPFGDRWVEIPTPSEIAKHLNVDRRTIQRASNALQEFGLFEFEIKRWRVKNTTVSTKTNFASGGKNVRSRTILPTNGSKCPESDQNVPNEANLPTNGSKCRNRPLKSAPSKDSSALQTIQTYTDFTQTLSNSERESFLDFGLKKAARLPNPPELPQKWIEKHFEELRQDWAKQHGIVFNNPVWEGHPLRQEWLDKIHSTGYASFIIEEGALDKERLEFYKWAESKGIINWGGSDE
jgi:hypothetical protein